MKFAIGLLGIVVCTLSPVLARATMCPPPANASTVDLQAQPFGIEVSMDGCWMFAATNGAQGHGTVAVLHDVGGVFSVYRVVGLRRAGEGEALTHDGKLLAVTEGDVVEVFSVPALEQASGDALAGWLRVGRDAGAVYALASLDDHLLFVSDELDHRISVYDLAKWRASDFRGDPHIGDIPTAIAPVGLALSPDGRWLYSTSETAPPRLGFAAPCKPEMDRERRHSQGLLIRIDVAKAAMNPTHATSGGLLAGCNPVRVVVSPDGSWLWVTARGDGTVLRIASGSLGSRAGNIHVESFPVGTSPVGIALRPDGHQVWVTLSDRFASAKGDGNGRQLVGLIGTDDPRAGAVTTVTEPVSGFPRELSFLPDGRTLAVGLFKARRIEFFTTPR